MEAGVDKKDIELRKAVEVLLFVHDRPITISEFKKVIDGEPAQEEIEAVLERLSRELSLSDKPYSLENIGGGWQYLTRPEFDPLIRKLVEVTKRETLTRAQLETLSVIAYSQPVTKGDIESIRGVGCGPVLKVLLEREYIRVTGRAERIGAPVLYGTGRQFLEAFGLKDISELPDREEMVRMFGEKLGQAEKDKKKEEKDKDKDAEEN